MLEMLAQLTLISGTLLICALPVALLLQLFRCYQKRERPANLSLTIMMMVGFVAAGTISWHALGSGWPLSFSTTLAASVDSETYGHPVEHAAENLLVAVLFFSVIGSVAVGTAGMVTRKRR